MREVAGVAGLVNGFHDGGPLQFLRRVELVAAGDAARVVVADPLLVVLDRPDDVALHDLHVVDVVQQLHVGRGHALHDLDPVDSVVALVVLVIDLAVEQLDDHRDVVLFGNGLDSVETCDRVGDRLIVGHALAIAEERDQTRHFRGLRAGDAGLEGLVDLVVERRVVHRVWNRAAALAGIADRDGEAVLRGDLEFLRLQQVHRGQAEIGDLLEEVLERDALVAPAAHRLLQPAQLDGLLLGSGPGSGQHRAGGHRAGGLDRITS